MSGQTPWGIPYPTSTDLLWKTAAAIRAMKAKANDLINNKPMKAIEWSGNCDGDGLVVVPSGLSILAGGVVELQGPPGGSPVPRLECSTVVVNTNQLAVRFYDPTQGANTPAAGAAVWLRVIVWGQA